MNSNGPYKTESICVDTETRKRVEQGDKLFSTKDYQLINVEKTNFS